ncbi:MAG TPA: di-heme oxidoredictase family protein, partial [Fimbriimonas sp.]|nr:di-heme oxidoredictase family protein [Fimbriimonas sp.]
GLYSDLLLHEMSPELADTGFYGLFAAREVERAAAPAGPRAEAGRRPEIGARLQEWRTPPLWGLRDSAPYLHDGRAQTIDQAIRLHGGQGSAAAQRYAQRSGRDRKQLENFLLSLAAPAARDGAPD